MFIYTTNRTIRVLDIRQCNEIIIKIILSINFKFAFIWYYKKKKNIAIIRVFNEFYRKSEQETLYIFRQQSLNKFNSRKTQHFGNS